MTGGSNPNAGARLGPWLTWLPLLILIAALGAMAFFNVAVPYGSTGGLLALNFLFSTISSLVVAFLIGRSFLLRGEPGLLLMGSGILVWGLTGLFSTIVGRNDPNDNVTIQNLGMCVAALSCLSGALLSLKRRARMAAPVAWLAAAYSAVLLLLAGITIVVLLDWTPVFFVQGTGGTPLRQTVLGSAVAMFAFTALLLRFANRGSVSPFLHWYTIGLLLISSGLTGWMFQTGFGNLMGWASRATQYLGGMYVLVAAIVSVRDAHAWEISLEGLLNEARQRYEELLDLAADGILVYDLSAGGKIAQANPAACALLGYDAAGIGGLTLKNLVAPDERGSVDATLDATLRAGVYRYETTLLAADGRRIAADVNARVVQERGGPSAIAVIRDITERKRVQDQVQELSQRLTYHVDNSPLAVIEWGPDMRLSRWSREAQRVFGWTAEEVLGKQMTEFPWIHPDDAAQVAEVSRSLTTGAVQNFSANRNLRKDGSVVFCDWYNSSLVDESGALRSILSLVLDVTARKQAEKELENSKRLLDALMENVPEGITIASAPDIRVELSSRQASELLGTFRVGVASADPPGWKVFAEDGVTPLADSARPLVRAICGGETVRDLELVLVHEDGRRIPLLCTAAPIRDAGGAIVGGVATWRDLTERKRAEERLLHSQKLESIGLLAGGIAHDFNNLLVGIIGNASLAQEMLGHDHAVSDLLGQVVRSGEHAAHLTRQMLAYAGKGRYLVEPVDLSKLAEDITLLVRPSISRKISVQLYLAPELPAIMADAGQVQQVVMNLVINAGEAIGDRLGLITVRTGTRDVAPGDGGAEPGRYLFVEVQDTGCGMDDATKSRIFDPFFTTKFTGRGLGLAAVSGIVRAHHGAVEVDSAPAKGSCFRVLLPVREAPAPAAPALEPRHVAAPGQTVLVVDDETVVRHMSARSLESAGFHVLAVEGCRQALDALAAEPEVSLVLIDLSMPGMDGVETLQEVRKAKPGIKALVSSGFSEHETMRLFSGMEVAGFLQKPYTAGRLTAAVQAALATGGAATR